MRGTQLKIALITDNGITISAHFGRASKYAVFTIENGEVVTREIRSKLGHKDFSKGDSGCDHHHDHHSGNGHGLGHQADEKHKRMFGSISDCEMVIVRGMGRGAHLAAQAAGITPLISDIPNIQDAVNAFIAGTLQDHPEKLH